jgi:hypothetical protein
MATSTARLQSLTTAHLQRAAPRRCAATRSPTAVVRRGGKAARPFLVTAALVAPQEGVQDTPFHWCVSECLCSVVVLHEERGS